VFPARPGLKRRLNLVVAMDVECSPRCGAKAQTKEAMACVPRASGGVFCERARKTSSFCRAAEVAPELGVMRLSCLALTVLARRATSIFKIARGLGARAPFFSPRPSPGVPPELHRFAFKRAARRAQAAPPSGAVSERVERARAWSLGFQKGGGRGTRSPLVRLPAGRGLFDPVEQLAQPEPP
jgi:hypothetical protein